MQYSQYTQDALLYTIPAILAEMSELIDGCEDEEDKVEIMRTLRVGRMSLVKNLI